MKTIWCKQGLLGPQGQFSGIQDLISFLSSSKIWQDLISNGTSSRILGPKTGPSAIAKGLHIFHFELVTEF